MLLHEDYFDKSRYSSVDQATLQKLENAMTTTSSDRLPFISEDLIPMHNLSFITDSLLELSRSCNKSCKSSFDEKKTIGDDNKKEDDSWMEMPSANQLLYELNHLAQVIQCYHPIFDNDDHVLIVGSGLTMKNIHHTIMFRRNINLTPSTLFVSHLRHDLSIVMKLVKAFKESQQYVAYMFHPRMIVMFPWLPYAVNSLGRITSQMSSVIARRLGLAVGSDSVLSRLLLNVPLGKIAFGLAAGMGHVITVCTVIEAMVQVYNYYQTWGNEKFQTTEACDFTMYHVILDEDKSKHERHKCFYKESDWMAIEIRKPICIDITDDFSIVEVIDDYGDGLRDQMELPDLPVPLLSVYGIDH